MLAREDTQLTLYWWQTQIKILHEILEKLLKESKNEGLKIICNKKEKLWSLAREAAEKRTTKSRYQNYI